MKRRLLNFKSFGKPFVFKVNVSNNESITIPVSQSYSYNFLISWGDGSANLINNSTSPNLSHTFLNGGEYTIKISGVCPSFIVNGSNSIRSNITQILEWGEVEFFQLNFRGCTNLDCTQIGDILDTSNLISGNCVKMFSQCTNLTFVNGMNNWDMSFADQMLEMFFQCTNFNQDLPNWDVSNVSSGLGMRNLFGACPNFNGDITTWDVSNCNNFHSTFGGCTSFNQDLGNWDVSGASTLFTMFSGCTVFNQDISGWTLRTTGNVNLGGLFDGCKQFNQDLSGWNTERVNNLGFTFAFCDNFNGDITTWDTSNVTSMVHTFDAALVFNRNINGWNVSNVSNYDQCFRNAFAFNQPLNNWVTTAATNMRFMFWNCTVFNQDISNFDLRGVLTVQSMLLSASSFNQDLSSWDISDMILMAQFGELANFSTSNWDLMLIAWEALPSTPQNITIGMNANYTLGGAADTARTSLINNFGWTINDAGGV